MLHVCVSLQVPGLTSSATRVTATWYDAAMHAHVMQEQEFSCHQSNIVVVLVQGHVGAAYFDRRLTTRYARGHGGRTVGSLALFHL
jgi:uncharacterized circularly permuted ATP-grasp superfamily protein